MAIPWAGMAELTLIVGRLMSSPGRSTGPQGKPCLLALKAHELLILAVGVGVPGAQKQWSRMILGSWASCSCWA
jgi:hypothetical protein